MPDIAYPNIYYYICNRIILNKKTEIITTNLTKKQQIILQYDETPKH